MTTPIRREIGQVFIPVRDIARAAAWYSRLLGVEVSAPSHDATIVDVAMEAGPGLALDANAPFTPDGPPRFFWWADDLGAVVAHLRELGADLVSDVVDIGSVAFVQFRDPDGNPLMVCARTSNGAAGTPSE
ncbi:putative enzyme related to lactoylglutathione lyase [Stackebrandtia albiflava]|uniref:Putative enzyme related to lactoylglutathione lyase n=1 Tax=Stackebrandtia albiflava TaxID=406432 RepID=A0A562UPQ7_9ACTN|nr:VOC family protein [Stackebrandtia albiflava]TWJ07599.1 putative enzyme related to lactoylglutathione lyase [Stackebrandtia albiflava]